MPEFVDISQLTKKSSATGTEEFQVSATEKVTAQQIADLGGSTSNPLDALMTGFSELTSGFGDNITTSDTLMMAIRKIWGHISGGTVRVIRGDYMIGMAQCVVNDGLGTGFIIDTNSFTITISPLGYLSASEFLDYTDEQLTTFIYANGTTYNLDKLSTVLVSQKSLNVLNGSTGDVQWNLKYLKLDPSSIILTLPSQNVSSHNASDTIEIWSSGDTTINFNDPGGTLVYLRDGDQIQPTGTLYKKTTITNPFSYYYYVTVDYFKSEY